MINERATDATPTNAPATAPGPPNDGGSGRVPARVAAATLVSTLAKVAFISAIVAAAIVGLANVIADALLFALAALIAVFWSSCSLLAALPGGASSSAASVTEE